MAVQQTNRPATIPAPVNQVPPPVAVPQITAPIETQPTPVAKRGEKSSRLQAIWTEKGKEASAKEVLEHYSQLYGSDDLPVLPTVYNAKESVFGVENTDLSNVTFADLKMVRDAAEDFGGIDHMRACVLAYSKLIPSID
jgi:hypothetical protein